MNSEKNLSLLKTNLFLTVLFLSLDRTDEDDAFYIKVLLIGGGFLGLYDYLLPATPNNPRPGPNPTPGPTPGPLPDTENTWRPGTSYVIGNIVKVNGVSWKCVEAHISSTNFVFDTQYWRHPDFVDNENTWRPGKSYLINDLVKVNGTEWKCILAHISSSVFAFDTQYWRSPNFVDTENTWRPNSVYLVGNIVKVNGTEWKCIQRHTSSSVFAFDTRYWRSPGWEPEEPDTGEWKSNFGYFLGDETKYNGKDYLCIETHTSGATFSINYWTLSGSPGIPGNPPTPGEIYWWKYVDYPVGALATYNDVRWVCTQSHNSGAFFNPGYWTPFNTNPPTPNPQPKRWWLRFTDYSVGDQVFYDPPLGSEKEYRCTTAHNSGFDFNTNYWQVI